MDKDIVALQIAASRAQDAAWRFRTQILTSSRSSVQSHLGRNLSTLEHVFEMSLRLTHQGLHTGRKRSAATNDFQISKAARL